MKSRILLVFSLLTIFQSVLKAQGLEGIFVEKYYQSNAADAQYTVTQGYAYPLPQGAVTYRVYVDMAAGYKFVQMFGTPTQNLNFSTSTFFYNDENYDSQTGPTTSVINTKKHTAMIDSWLTTGGTANGKVGVTKDEDTDGTIANGATGNTNGILFNTLSGCFGNMITGTTGKDGMLASSGTTVVAPNVLGMGGTILDALTAGNSVGVINVSNGAIAALGGIVGPTSSNRVLVGQFTTSGTFTFSINVQLLNPSGVAENYVHSNMGSGQYTHPTLIRTASSPAVTISSDAAGNQTCVGNSVIFTAVASNAGIPAYQWKVNGNNVGTNSATFSSSSLSNGSAVTCVVTPDCGSSSNAPVTSNTISLTVNNATNYFVDNDGDGFGSGSATSFCANPGAGYSLSNTDCNDANASINPNGTEICNQLDDDCDNVVDDGVSVVPSVSIVSNDADNTICSGSSVTFTAAPINGGTAPSYQWKVNGVNAGTNATSFTTTTLTNNASVTVVMTANNACQTTATTTSNSIVTTVNNNVTPGVSIISSDADNTICSGSSVTFTATPTNGGSTPSYQWKVNGVNAGTNATSFSSASLNNNASVTVVMTSNNTCQNSSTATSNAIVTTVNNNVTPGVSIISSDADNTICSGGSVTFTATPSNGGSAPSYQWKVNGVNAGTNATIFTSTTLTNNAAVTVELTANNACQTTTTATSNSIVTTVNNNVTPGVVIISSDADNTICSGSSVTFTATPSNGGSAPAYQWKVNGVNAGTNATSFTSSTLNNNASVTVAMTSNNTCQTTATATSNSIVTTVNNNVTPGVVIISSDADNTICSGSSVTFTATPSNGGSAPSYQWKVNGVNAGTNATSFTSTSLTNNASVTLEMTANNACQSVSLVSSNSVVMNVLDNVNYFQDADGDGFGAGNSISSCVNPGVGYALLEGDCDDANLLIYPGQSESCNLIDDNCNGEVDEFVQTEFYQDADGDGFGNLNASTFSCIIPDGYVSNGLDCDDNQLTFADTDGDGYGSDVLVDCGVLNHDDCDDSNSAIYLDANELCNNLDDNCNGEIDEFVQNTYYADQDGDGFGNLNNVFFACVQPLNYVNNSDDCDDQVVTFQDLDGDGYGSTVTVSCGVPNQDDCMDNDAGINPSAIDICGNGIDENCDGVDEDSNIETYFLDADGDGFGDSNVDSISCSQPAGYVLNHDDCDDNLLTYLDADFDFVGGTELAACGVESNADCNDQNPDIQFTSTLFADADGDGYGNVLESITVCAYFADGYVNDHSDCDDSNLQVNSAAIEVCNLIDDDCDGEIDELVQNIYFADQDGDGFGNLNEFSFACSAPSGYVVDFSDCDDNQLTYVDADGDNFGGSMLSACGVLLTGDCDDANASINISQVDICGNQIDEDCSGLDSICAVFGCTDVTAINYNASANTDDGSCIPVLYGCIDNTAFNYNPAANTDNGSCIAVVLGCTDNLALNFNPAANTDNGTCIAVIYGCTDLAAFNYNPAANTDNGTCIAVVLGCTDNTALNFNPIANTDNGTCIAVVYGCTDNIALNFNPVANTDNGTCIAVVLGCTDNMALNFNPDANTDNGTCIAVIYGCTDNTAINYDPAANTDNGTCISAILGCTDVNACNYDGMANVDNGSCFYPQTEVCNLMDDNCNGEIDEFVQNTYFADLDQDGFGDLNNVVFACDVPSGYTVDSGDCDDNALTFVDADGDGFGGIELAACGVLLDGDCNDLITSINPLSIEICGNGIDEDCNGMDDSCEIFGCMDVLACNYDPSATIDDLSCIMPSIETCNGLDDNCNGEIDEFVQNTYYADLDLDGFGDLNNISLACSQPQGYVDNSFDCDDNVITYMDTDGDGFGSSIIDACGVLQSGDCLDFDDTINPLALEVCDGVDQNCDGTADEGVQLTFYADNDNDGFGDVNNVQLGCTQTAGYVVDNTDCDDAQILYVDFDQDGYGSNVQAACGVSDTTDCDDQTATVNPGATEIANNNVDENCDGEILDVQNISSANIMVYPVPTADFVQLVGLTDLQGMLIEMFDTEGKKVHTRQINGDVERIDCLSYANGLYSIRVVGSNLAFTVVIEH